MKLCSKGVDRYGDVVVRVWLGVNGRQNNIMPMRRYHSHTNKIAQIDQPTI